MRAALRVTMAGGYGVTEEASFHMSEQNISSTMQENRLFPPPPGFAAKAHIKSREEYDRMYRESIDDPESFWGRAAEPLHWFKRWDRVLDWKVPFARWFVGGKTNVAYNCLDRQIELGRGDKTAILWEGEPEPGSPGTGGGVRRLSFKDLHAAVCKFAGGLKKLGVKRGDRVTIYMPMVPEAAVAMLACARIGAPHSVIFGGFSSQAIADRVADAQSHFVITADGGYRRGKASGLKVNVDEAVARTPSIEHVLVVRRTGEDVTMQEGRDIWWHDLVPVQEAWCEPERMESEDMLYLLYTSGTTAKPKGILHTTGGYLTGVASTHRNVFDIKDDDVYWCAADIGWVTGHSYIVYGPLANHTTGVMYEGTPDWPDPSRWWDIVARYGVTILYTAPTAIRAHMKWGPQHSEQHNL